MVDASGNALPRSLHLALALLIAVEGALNVRHGISGQDRLLVSFGVAEVVGALCFVWPRATAAGACILVCTFLVAAGIHLAELEFPSGHLVYAVAVLAVLIHRSRSPTARRSAA